MRGALVVLSILSLALAVTASGEEPAVRVSVGPNAIAVANADGTWTVRTRCLGTARRTVGPGYVSRFVTSDGAVLVDDFRRPGTLNDPEFGGLGAFGWHHARGMPGKLRFSGRNAWEISGRICAARNGGFGVSSSGLVEPPLRIGDAIEFGIVVRLSDGFTFPRALLQLNYRYRVEPEAVRVHVDVVPLCPVGRCGHTRKLAFVKEPKFVAHATGGDFTRMATFRRDGSLACVYVGGGGLEGPIYDTGQCGDSERSRLRFDRGTGATGTEGGCATTACLDVSVGGDLDDWAQAAAAQRPAFHRDTASIDGVVWDCKGGSPVSPDVRRWETTGRLARGRYVSLGGIFPAWEGGRGGYDCEPLARPFPRAGMAFGTDLTLALAHA